MLHLVPPSVRVKSSVLSICYTSWKDDFFFPVLPTYWAVKKGNTKNLLYSHTNTNKQEELVCKRLPVAKALPHPGCSHWYGLSPVWDLSCTCWHPIQWLNEMLYLVTSAQKQFILKVNIFYLSKIHIQVSVYISDE